MVSADSGRMCRMATFKKSAPAKVVPSVCRTLFVLKLWSLNGNVPTTVTIVTKRIMNETFRMASIV